jgi:hypothetical protein
MARNGIAKGINSGHITTARELAPKPSSRKGVSYFPSETESSSGRTGDGRGTMAPHSRRNELSTYCQWCFPCKNT